MRYHGNWCQVLKRMGVSQLFQLLIIVLSSTNSVRGIMFIQVLLRKTTKSTIAVNARKVRALA